MKFVKVLTKLTISSILLLGGMLFLNQEVKAINFTVIERFNNNIVEVHLDDDNELDNDTDFLIQKIQKEFDPLGIKVNSIKFNQVIYQHNQVTCTIRQLLENTRSTDILVNPQPKRNIFYFSSVPKIFSAQEIEDKTQQLMALGFSRDKAETALKEAPRYDMNRAIEYLIHGAIALK